MRSVFFFTVAFVVLSSLFATVSARRTPKLVQSLEKKQGYLGWGLPSLDFSSKKDAEGVDHPGDGKKSHMDVKEVRRTPKNVGSETSQKQEPSKKRRGLLFGLRKKDPTPTELFDMADGLE